MNSYASTCTHQQTTAGRKAAAKILAALPAKEYGFWIGNTKTPKTHAISMVKKGFLDGWRCRILDGRVNLIPGNQWVN